ncbi:chemotaxis protein CheW [Kaarinaea lacus]
MRDCWNKIGVWSRQPAKCEKLREVIHCRNCDVYTKAGRKVIEKRMPAEYLTQWTKSYAQIPPENHLKQCSVIMFRLGMEWFCLPTMYCESVENPGSIHSIPRYSNQLFQGIVNIRGNLQLCFSLEALLQVVPEDSNPLAKIGVYKRLVVLNYHQQYYVFLVDEVGGIDRIDDKSLEAAPATLSQRQAEFVKGIIVTNERSVAFLNAPPLFSALEEAIGG